MKTLNGRREKLSLGKSVVSAKLHFDRKRRHALGLFVLKKKRKLGNTGTGLTYLTFHTLCGHLSVVYCRTLAIGS